MTTNTTRIKYKININSSRKRKIEKSIIEYMLCYGIFFIPKNYDFKVVSKHIDYYEQCTEKGTTLFNRKSAIHTELNGRVIVFLLDDDWNILKDINYHRYKLITKELIKHKK